MHCLIMKSLNKFLFAEVNEVSISYKNLTMTSRIELFEGGDYICNLSFFRDGYLVLPQSLNCEDAMKLLTLYKEKIDSLRDQKFQGDFRLFHNIYRLNLTFKKSIKHLVGSIDNWSIATIFNSYDNFVKSIHSLNGTKINIIPSTYETNEINLYFHNYNTILVDIIRSRKYSVIMDSFRKLFSFLNLLLYIDSATSVLLSIVPTVSKYYTFDMVIFVILILLSILAILVVVRYYLKKLFKNWILDYILEMNLSRNK